MKKKTILVRKLHRAFNNKRNIEYSKFKGYPEDTYFGYYSFDECKKDTLKDFVSYYGKGLRHCKLNLL